MDASISASLGAMGSLIGKLNVLLLEASEDEPGDLRRRLWLPKGLKDGIDLLKEDLEEISSYLQDLSEVEDPPLTAKCWMREVRELSYDIEDYIDSFARPRRSGSTKTRFIRKISNIEFARLPKKKLTYKQVAGRISEFRTRAQDANLRHERYELNCHNFRCRYAPVGPMLPTASQEGADLVMDGRMRELIDTIASDDRDRHLKVLSIVGPGGIGKTTLVRVLYNKIRGQFQFRTFIRMTRKPDVKTVLREMLTQVQRQQPNYHCEDLDLIGEIRKQIQDKRYLIIIDDLWSASVWNLINHAFPEGNLCSRVIVTTQIEDVALTCCNYHSECVLEMRPLDSFHSRNLFFSRAFGSESDCPGTFKEVSKKIVEICGGLPLALISVASLLASHPVVSGEKCAYISDALSSNLRASSASEGLRQVLNLSYNNLTHCLKTCLLYLTMYPEGYTISKHDLVNQWVAEGFIPATEGRDMDQVAGGYFHELIDRRLLQPACIKYNNAIVSCTVHDMVNDLITYKASEENFVMVINNYRKNVELCDNVHRLSLHFVDAKHSKKPKNIRMSQIRSLSFFGFFMCMPNITEFKLLRVLNVQLYGHHGDDIFDLTGISELFHLRYLKVAGDICIDLPKHTRGLQYMETLDIDTKVTAVPWDIIHIPCLLHLHLPFETNLMDWIGSMRSESLKKPGKLINLRDLCLTYFTTPQDQLERNIEALGSLVTGLGNLKTLSLVAGSSHEKAVVHSPSKLIVSWDDFVPPLPLQRFEWSLCSCTFPRVPKWIGQFANLCVLKFTVNELLRDGVDILKGLPALTTLSLNVHAAPVEMIVFDKAGFSVLKYLKFRCCESWLKFEADAMPNLLKLKLGFNAHRVDHQRVRTHISIGHLSSINEISVKIWGAGADADSSLAAAIINHPSNPQINIQLADWIVCSDKGKYSATEEKDHGRIEQDDMMEEAEDEVSKKDEDENTETEEQKHGRIEQEDIIEETEDEVSRADENKQADIRPIDGVDGAPSVEARRLAVVPQLDIEQIVKEAQHRWLRPAEICEILKNYRNLHIAPEPPNRPPSGSLFLFDRKVLRYFRKDGHNWRKKNDKRTVKEAHERLKSGSIDVLHCYYAHGEDNINFQRRTYWMLKEDFMHIVLVHYLETKGGKSSRTRSMVNKNMIQEDVVDSLLSQLPSQTREGERSLSGQASDYEEAESGYLQSSVQQIVHEELESTLSGCSSMKMDNRPVLMPLPQFPVPCEQGTSTEGLIVDYLTFDEVYSGGLSLKDTGATEADGESFWQLPSAIGDLSTAENSFPQSNDGYLEAAIGGYPFLKTQSSNLSDILKDSFNRTDSFSSKKKKTDSFTRWMSKEFSEVEDCQVQSSFGEYWSTEEADSIIEASSRELLDQFTVPSMLTQDQLFSIVNFAPSWTYVGSKTKILVTGNILNNSQVTKRCKWSCMFGEVEVPAKILKDGTLICYSPQHKPGRVPFYITCSNRLACSEVREFEFRPTVTQYMDAPSPHGATNKVYFQIRLDKLLSLGPDEYQATVSNPSLDMIELSKKIGSLMMSNDEWSNLLKLAVDNNEHSTDDQQDQFAENLIKDKLHVWLLNKVGVGGRGPSVLDDEGQGVLHLAAALGYDWTIRPTLAAGVNINFRDVHGWTALHWAAFCGREQTVVALIALGAAPGALTDPSPAFPERTPADLASSNGQKGISGFLAESSLTSHLQSLNLKEANMAEISGLPGIGDVNERDLLQPPSGDSLGPVRNAAQAAARIFQVFRVLSFQRKQAAQYEDDKGGMSDERALSLLSVKPSKPGQLDPLHSAATRIQNKFWGWKGRKDFLLIRQQIVKIQAHVRGHQVRKRYRKIVWSIGIVEKISLRWRRRGAGLRGFRSTEGSSAGTSSSLIQDKPFGDDYDFLQEGRKQTEERLQKALARVKSMAQYPEARDQYQRIYTVVSKMQESQAMQEKMAESAEMDEGYLMNELQELLNDDTSIPGYF